jgi:hypothetical protein
MDMKSTYFKNFFGAAVMAFSLILGFAAASTAQAQYQYPDSRYRQQDDRYRRDQDRNQRDNDRWNQDRRGRGRGWDGYPNWGGNYELRQTALNAGYNAGVKEGRNDRSRRRGYGYSDFGQFSSYRSADRDYNGRFGDRELYRRYFRMAFQNGYADGLRGY